MKVVPMSVCRDVPAPRLVHHRHVVAPQGIIRNDALNGARHRAVSAVCYSLGMKSPMTNAELVASDVEFIRLSSFERFRDGSGWRCNIAIQVAWLSCTGKTFYFDDLLQFTNELQAAYDAVSGSAELRCRYEREFVKLEYTPLGRVSVSGELLEYYPEPCTLKFTFSTDQTFMPGFLNGLRNVLGALHA
jgi:hypothetical protein